MGKIYVGVWSFTDPEGRVSPLKIEWTDGQRFDVDKVLGRRIAAPQGVVIAASSIRYTIVVSGQKRELYHEPQTGKWFVVTKN